MKLSFAAFVFVFAVQFTIAQKELPAFGKIDLADMQLQDCSFEPGAAAYKLIDWGNIYFTSDPENPARFKTMYEKRVRIKILKEPGLSYANLTLPFYSNNNERITRIDACTYNLTDGNKIKTTTLHKKEFYIRRINKQYGQIVFIFPEVKTGSVIEYKYLLERKTVADVKDWYFQSDIPTRYSECQLTIPAAFHFIIQPLTAGALEAKERSRMERQIVKGRSVNSAVLQRNFIMRNLQAVPNETYMSTAKDYLQRLSFRLSAIEYSDGTIVDTPDDWEAVADDLMGDPDFGKQITNKSIWSRVVKEVAGGIGETGKKAALIYYYVKANLDWDGREAVYSFQGVKQTFEKKRGSSGDINLLLISLLHQAGLHALPVLFSTRDNGLVNPNLPVINQFNTVMALVEDKGKTYILDATDKYAAYGLVPLKVINTRGLVVEQDNTRWIDATDTINKYKVISAIRGYIDSAGVMKGDGLTTALGYAREQLYREWTDSKNTFSTQDLTSEYTSLQVESNQVENLGPDSLPLEQQMRFSMPLPTTGKHRYFKLNLFSDLQKNPFTAAKRYTDIDFCYQKEYTIYGSYTIPGDYAFEEIPQDISLIMPDTSIIFKRFVTAENNSLNVRMSVDFRRSWYAAGEYAEFADFYKTLLSKLNEPVIIKKKDQL